MERKIKNLIIVLMVCAMSLLLTSCGISEEEATEFVGSMTSDAYSHSDRLDFPDLSECVEQENFQNAVSDVLESGTPKECFCLFYNLNEFYDDVDDETLREFFQEYLSELRNCVFSDTAEISFHEYVDLVREYIVEADYDPKYEGLEFVPVENNNYYASFEDCLPYEQTAEYIKTHGEVPIFKNGQGGYYDDKHDDYVSTSKLVDPLHIGEGQYSVGTMRETQDYYFHGDFLLSEHHEQWYGTSSSGTKELYFRDVRIYNDSNADSYLDVLMGADTYMIPKNNSYRPYVMKNDRIMFNRTDFMLVFDYSTDEFELRTDDTLVATESNGDGQCDVDSWTDIVAVSVGEHHTIGLRSDGTVVATGLNDDGQCDVDSWTDIVAVSVGEYHTIGLRSDGTVVATGLNYEGQCDVDGWADIVAVSTSNWHTVGLKSDGTVVATGVNNYGQCDIDSWADIVAVSASNWHTVGLKSDGTVVATGVNNDGQCDIDSWADIVAVSASNWHTVGLKSDGTIVAAGSSITGACDVDGWTDIVAISTGYDHTVGLKSDGTVVATGLNDNGQCDVGSWTDIVAVSTGDDHTVGLKSDGTVVATEENDGD